MPFNYALSRTLRILPILSSQYGYYDSGLCRGRAMFHILRGRKQMRIGGFGSLFIGKLQSCGALAATLLFSAVSLAAQSQGAQFASVRDAHGTVYTGGSGGAFVAREAG